MRERERERERERKDFPLLFNDQFPYVARNKDIQNLIYYNLKALGRCIFCLT